MNRKRNWATIVYPESAKENWLDLLSEFYLDVFISPLHDNDLDRDGNLKKPHYHLLFIFDGNKSYSQIISIVEKIGGVGAIPIESKNAYARYLCHLDNPEKHSYNISDVKSFGSLNYSDIISSKNDSDDFILLINLIKNNHLYSIKELIDYSLSENPSLIPVIRKNFFILKEYLINFRYLLK